MSKKHQTTTRGFTIVETLVAITILLLTLAGPLSIATKGMTAALIARDQVQAFYFAQEAVEQLRGRRDQNGIIGQDWLTGLEVCTGGHCRVDVRDNSIVSCETTCPPLRYDESTGFYGYSVGTETDIVRDITMTQISGTEMEIVVTVSWQTGVFSRSVTVKDHLLDWQK
jgi:type II secretory pathway pseudopilin PulG